MINRYDPNIQRIVRKAAFDVAVVLDQAGHDVIYGDAFCAIQEVIFLALEQKQICVIERKQNDA